MKTLTSQQKTSLQMQQLFCLSLDAWTAPCLQAVLRALPLQRLPPLAFPGEAARVPGAAAGGSPPRVRTCLDTRVFSFNLYVGQRREAALHAGCLAAEGRVPQHHPEKEQHGVRLHHHWRGRARRVSAGEKRDSGRARGAGREDGDGWVPRCCLGTWFGHIFFSTALLSVFLIWGWKVTSLEGKTTSCFS